MHNGARCRANVMLYKFKSKAAGDVIMTAPVGDKVLRAMGREPAVQGILEASGMAALLATLDRSIADDEARRSGTAESDTGSESHAAGGRELGLKQRAWPLVEMMRKADAAHSNIVWGV